MKKSLSNQNRWSLRKARIKGKGRERPKLYPEVEAKERERPKLYPGVQAVRGLKRRAERRGDRISRIPLTPFHQMKNPQAVRSVHFPVAQERKR
jgi:hypothetical protein